jgi:rRNA biogenesis protein RRP5
VFTLFKLISFVILHYRQVLERGVAQNLPARKMKSLFAKFLQFEERHGTPEGVEQVRQMAVRYVEAVTDRMDDDE